MNIKLKCKAMDVIEKVSKAGKQYHILNLYLNGIGACEEFLPDNMLEKVLSTGLNGVDCEAVFNVVTQANKIALRLSDLQLIH